MSARPLEAPAQFEPKVSDASLAPTVPVHVGIIMDGNGRWARGRGLERSSGHRAGTDNIARVTRALAERGVKYLTIFGFSTENWSRPAEEVDALMDILGEVIEQETLRLHEQNVRLQHLGGLDRLSPQLRKAVKASTELTRDNDGLTLNVAFDYGGREEILEAVRRILRDGLSPEQISEELFCRYLSTRGMPDPDLIVRTGGEMRLSNFLIWQSHYSEYYSTPALWPDFDESEVDRALEEFRRRQRRFGGL